jgi:hypothetical protein
VGEAVTTAVANDMTIAFDAAGCSALAYGIRDGSWRAQITATHADGAAAARHDQSRRGDRAGATLHAA